MVTRTSTPCWSSPVLLVGVLACSDKAASPAPSEGLTESGDMQPVAQPSPQPLSTHLASAPVPVQIKQAWVRVAAAGDDSCIASFDLLFDYGGMGYVEEGQVYQTDDRGRSWSDAGMFSGELERVGKLDGSLMMLRELHRAGVMSFVYRASGDGQWEEVLEGDELVERVASLESHEWCVVEGTGVRTPAGLFQPPAPQPSPRN